MLKLCSSLKCCYKCKSLSLSALKETPPFNNYLQNIISSKCYLFFTIISFVFLEYTNLKNYYTIKNYEKQIDRKKTTI